MKITSIKFNSSAQQILGIGSAKQFVRVGDQCDNAWGGGFITSLDYDPASASLLIRKGGRFERIQPQERESLPSFDVAIVPWLNVSCACGVDGEEIAGGKTGPSYAEFLSEILKLRTETIEMLAGAIKASIPAVPSVNINQGSQQRR